MPRGHGKRRGRSKKHGGKGNGGSGKRAPFGDPFGGREGHPIGGSPSPTSLPNIPNSTILQSATMDVYPNQAPPIVPASVRVANVSILIAPNFEPGTRSRAAGGQAYTHIIVCDPTIEVHDGYANSSNLDTNGDFLCVPAGQTANYFRVVMVTVAVIPGKGKKKIIHADRNTVGNWPAVF